MVASRACTDKMHEHHLYTTHSAWGMLQSLVHVLAAMAPCTRLYGFLGCQLARSQRVTGVQLPANCRMYQQ